MRLAAANRFAGHDETPSLADPDRFTVAVADLEGDSNPPGLSASVFRQMSEYAGIRFVRLGRALRSGGSGPHDDPGAVLEETGCQAMIFGVVTDRRNGKFNLGFITNKDEQGAEGGGPDDALQVEDVLWGPLQRSFARFAERRFEAGAAWENERRTHLEPIARQMITVLHGRAAHPLSRRTRWEIGRALGGTAGLLSIATREIHWLHDSVFGFLSALESIPSDVSAGERARARCALGEILQSLYDRKPDPNVLELAAEEYRTALPDLPLRATPPAPDVPGVQYELAQVYETLGIREKDAARQEQAAAALRAARKILTPKNDPVEWRNATSFLRIILKRLVTREFSVPTVVEYETVARDELAYTSRETSPEKWADLQDGVGSLQFVMAHAGKESRGMEEEAEATLRAALSARDRRRNPVKWATTNLAVADVIGEVAEERGDPSKSCESLDRALDSWTELRNSGSSLARTAADSVRRESEVLRKNGSREAKSCLEAHAKALAGFREQAR